MRNLMLIGVVVGVCASHSAAQNWAPIGLPYAVTDWGNFYLDSTTNELYVSGQNSVTLGNVGIFKFDGADWSTIGLFSQKVNRVLHYNDTLLAGGGFYMAGGDSIRGCAFWDGADWFAYGLFDGPVFNLRILDGELYAVGGFRHVDGQPADGIAKRVGGHWEPVGDFGEVQLPYLFDVIKYQGKLVACGNMSIVGVNYRDVYVYENGQWGPLGGGLFGGASGGWEMTIYNGELILGGNFYLSAGNAGQSLMRWNGSIWQPLGEGLTDLTDSHTYAPQVYALTVQQGKLFVGGGFSYAGHVPAQGIAVWDGDVWCGLGSQLGLVHDIVFYNDTLFAMHSSNMVDGQNTSGGVRYLHTTFGDTCSLATGMAVPEPAVERLSALVQDGTVQVLGLMDGRTSFAVLDLSGRSVAKGTLISQGGRSNPIATFHFAEGVYMISVEGHVPVKFVVR